MLCLGSMHSILSQQCQMSAKYQKRELCIVQCNNALQVEVEIETMDRGGTFLGTLRTCEGSKYVCFHMGPDLLEAGLAKLHPSFDPDRVPGGRELAAAQERAQSARLKVCHS